MVLSGLVSVNAFLSHFERTNVTPQVTPLYKAASERKSVFNITENLGRLIYTAVSIQ